MNDLGAFANSLWEDLGSPTSPSVSYISGWAESNVGVLNVKLNTTFEVSGGYFQPSFGNAESGVYSQMFNVRYYERRARDAIHNTLDASGSLSWTRISEGDTSITRASPNETMKVYTSLKKDAQLELDALVKAYKRNLFAPRQVVSDLQTNE